MPIQATLKPLVDVLFTLKGKLKLNSPWTYLLKGGIAYRQLDLENRTSSKDSMGQVNGEFQAGLGYTLTEHMMLIAFYQGIYASGESSLSINNSTDILLNNIPTQQAGFLGIEYSF